MRRHLRPSHLLDGLVDALREGYTSTAPCYLSHRERWNWLVDTLLGHPRVQKGQRPRDFPADPAGRNAVTAAVRLHARPLDSWNSHRVPTDHDWRFGSWIYAFSLMVEGTVLRREPQRCEELCHQAILWVVYQVLRACGAVTDDGECQRLLAALGMGLRDGGPLIEPPLSQWGSKVYLGQSQGDPISAAAEAAAWLAILDQHHTRSTKPPKLPKLKNPMARSLLAETQIWVVTLKTQKIQSYLERAMELWVTRGASVWATQILALAREQLLAVASEGSHPEVPDMLLLADVDALSKFACFATPECAAMMAFLKRRLREVWSARGFESGLLDQHFPRLGGFLRTLPPGVREEALADLSTCLPELCLEVSPSMSLAELCCRRELLPKEEIHTAEREMERCGTRCVSKPSSWQRTNKKCDFVRKSRGLITENLVSWMHPENPHRLIGWIGIVWSLASATYRMHASHGLGEMLQLPGMPLRDDHKEWMASLSETGRPVAYLKLDGDHVGENLRRLPVLRSLQTGLQIQPRTFDGLRHGIQEAIKHLKSRHPGSLGRHSRCRAMPIELVYQGGDDLLCILPYSVLGAFLKGFARPRSIQATRTFTGAALIVPGNLIDQGPQVPFLAARLLPIALEWAKNRSRNKPVAPLAKKLRHEASKAGFVLRFPQVPEVVGKQVRVWTFSLIPEEGSNHLSATGESGLG